MIEGVLAVNLDQRMLALNLAAADMLLADASAAVGQHLAEVIRNIELARFVAHVLAADGPLEREIVLRNALGRPLRPRPRRSVWTPPAGGSAQCWCCRT